MPSKQQIALNFFPLKTSDFNINIRRRVYKSGEKTSDFPECSQRFLPLSDKPGEKTNFWVSFKTNTLDGFEPYTCNSLSNLSLTNDYLFQLLEQNCRKSLTPNQDFFLKESFRKGIFFILKEFSEGKEVVWLEPYFLKSAKQFGFLVDFEFHTNNDVLFTKRIQQLSLSLDKDGKKNTNFYADKYEKVKLFGQKYFSSIFPLVSFENEYIDVQKNLLNLQADTLQSKTYVFGNSNTDKSQFMGVKRYGPLLPPPDDVKLYFIYREAEKSFSQDLYRALRGDTFSNTFPGMEIMFHFKLTNENVSGKSIENFSAGEIEKVIDAIKKDSAGKHVVPVLVTPFSYDDFSDEASEQYYIAKHTFLRHHIPSQFVSLKKIQAKEQIKWAISNIGLQLFAKMGGQPWIVRPKTNKCLIIGLGQAHKKKGGNIEKYFAYSVLTDASGLYKDLKILSQSHSRETYLNGFRENLIKIFRQYFNEYESFVVHTPFKLQDEELSILDRILDELSNEAGNTKKFVAMKFNDHNKFFGYAFENNSMVPYESSYIRLAYKEYLVWFEGLQYQNPIIRKTIEQPLHVEFIYPTQNLDDEMMKVYLQDALNLSGANWRGFNAKSLPVSVYYAQLVAKYYKEFQNLNLEDVDLEKITPWFL
jgi:hypothetical protein